MCVTGNIRIGTSFSNGSGKGHGNDLGTCLVTKFCTNLSTGVVTGLITSSGTGLFNASGKGLRSHLNIILIILIIYINMFVDIKNESKESIFCFKHFFLFFICSFFLCIYILILNMLNKNTRRVSSMSNSNLYCKAKS